VPALSSAETVADIPANPEVLKWARTVRGLSLEAAARRLGIQQSELDDYEHKRRRPNLSMLRKMSEKYRINEAALLMPEPIEDAEVRPLTDYRINGHGNPGFEANVAIREHAHWPGAPQLFLHIASVRFTEC
jgi:transcriptional regulator with XRE-family HTH domain